MTTTDTEPLGFRLVTTHGGQQQAYGPQNILRGVTVHVSDDDPGTWYRYSYTDGVKGEPTTLDALRDALAADQEHAREQVSIALSALGAVDSDALPGDDARALATVISRLESLGLGASRQVWSVMPEPVKH